MKGITLFTHAIGMVFGNPGAALRISGLLMAFQFALVIGLDLQVLFLPVEPEPVLPGEMPAATLPPAALIFWLVQLFSGFWIAVAWQRFILREEVPMGIVPAFRGRAMLRYLGIGLLLMLILALAAIPLVVLVTFIVGPMALATQNLAAMLAFGVLVFVPITYLGLRLSPILTAAALEEKLPLREAWYRTGASGGAIFVLTLLAIAGSFLLNLPAAVLVQGLSGLAFLYAFLSTWLVLLLSTSLITTIYGHYIEDRPLNA